MQTSFGNTLIHVVFIRNTQVQLGPMSQWIQGPTGSQVPLGPTGSDWVQGPTGSQIPLGPRSHWVPGPTGSQVPLGPRSHWVSGPRSQVPLGPRSHWVPGPTGSQVPLGPRTQDPGPRYYCSLRSMFIVNSWSHGHFVSHVLERRDSFTYVCHSLFIV